MSKAKLLLSLLALATLPFLAVAVRSRVASEVLGSDGAPPPGAGHIQACMGEMPVPSLSGALNSVFREMVADLQFCPADFSRSFEQFIANQDNTFRMTDGQRGYPFPGIRWCSMLIGGQLSHIDPYNFVCLGGLSRPNGAVLTSAGFTDKASSTDTKFYYKGLSIEYKVQGARSSRKLQLFNYNVVTHLVKQLQDLQMWVGVLPLVLQASGMDVLDGSLPAQPPPPPPAQIPWRPPPAQLPAAEPVPKPALEVKPPPSEPTQINHPAAPVSEAAPPGPRPQPPAQPAEPPAAEPAAPIPEPVRPVPRPEPTPSDENTQQQPPAATLHSKPTGGGYMHFAYVAGALLIVGLGVACVAVYCAVE